MLAPSLLHGIENGLSATWHRLFNVVALDRVLAFVLVCSLLLNLLPGELGRVVRRNLARTLDMTLKGLLYFIAGTPRLIAAPIYVLSQKR